MKLFKAYQHLDGEPMTERDKLEIDSKSWNEGKWYNFIQPFISTDDSLEDKTLIDVGCNAGLFLHLAKDFGFGSVIGLEPDIPTYERAVFYRGKHNLDYKIINKKIEDCDLPLSDFTVFANSHYYITPEDWKKCIDKLKEKTRYVIIVTAEKKPNKNYAASDLEGIRKDFEGWQEVDVIDIPKDDSPHSRHLTSVCFKNNTLDRVAIDSLDNGNKQLRDFLKELDNGIDVFKTRYYKRLADYRKRTGSKQTVWTDDELKKYMIERVDLYKDIKVNGQKEAITVRSKDNRIVDGNHRHDILRHLGFKTIIQKYE